MMALPQCDFRRDVTGRRCRCDCPRVHSADGTVPLSLCRICPQRTVDGAMVSPPGRQAEQAKPFAFLPCTHRGEELRQEKCNLCGSLDRFVPVHACKIHGECSVSRYNAKQAMPICTRCNERSE